MRSRGITITVDVFVCLLQSACCWVCVWPPCSLWHGALQWGSNGYCSCRSAAVGHWWRTEYYQHIVTPSAGHCRDGRVWWKRSHSVVGGQQHSAGPAWSILDAAAQHWLSSNCLCSDAVPRDFTTAVFWCRASQWDWWWCTSAFRPCLRTLLHSSTASHAAITAASTATGLLPASRWLLHHNASAVDTWRTSVQFGAFITSWRRQPVSLH